MPAAPASAATTLEADLASILATNFAAYQELAGDYRRTSVSRLRHALLWLWKIFVRTRPAERGQALDIGCADGAHAYLLAERGYEVTAVDFSPRMIQLAVTRLAGSGLPEHRRPRFLTGEFLAGRFTDATGQVQQLHARQFDLVIANAFVHLFPRPIDKAVVESALDLVAHRGTALFSTTIEDVRDEGYFLKEGSDGTLVQRWRGHYPKDDFLTLVRDTAGDTFDITDHPSEDMRGRPWLTVIATRSRDE